MNFEQFNKIFKSDNQVKDLLDYLKRVLEISKQVFKAGGNYSGVSLFPSIFKAALIKTYGYLI